MKNMSFMLTTNQIILRTKTVTRRVGWRKLESGVFVQAVEKGMGLRRGEVIKKLAIIKIKDTRWEPLNIITQEELVLEGFPDKTPEWFIDMFCSSHAKCKPDALVNRIEFEYF